MRLPGGGGVFLSDWLFRCLRGDLPRGGGTLAASIENPIISDAASPLIAAISSSIPTALPLSAASNTMP